jgi:hemoglobin-like flavoprotein
VNPDRAERIRESYLRIQPRVTEAVEAFYSRLFEASPDARALFSTDMSIQRNHLATAIGLIAKHAGNFSVLESTMRAKGKRHAEAGVQPHQFDLFRREILRALEEADRAAWSDQLRDDWAWAIDRTIGAMLAGSAERRRSA